MRVVHRRRHTGYEQIKIATVGPMDRQMRLRRAR